MQKKLFDFGDLDPIFKVTGGQKMLNNALSVPCLLNGSLATQIHHWEMQKKLLDFGDLDPIFKFTGGQRMLQNALFALYLLKG